MEVYCALTSQSKVAELNENLEILRTFELAKMSGPKSMLRLENILLCANIYDGSVAKIDLNKGLMEQKRVCSYPTCIGQCGDTLVVTCGETDFVYLIDEELNATKIFSSSGFPIHFDSNGSTIAVALLYGKRISLYDIHTLKETLSIPIDGFPNCVHFHGDKLYVSYSDEGYFSNGYVEVFDLAGNSLMKNSAKSMPTKLLCFEDRLYCLNTGDDSLNIYDLHTLELLKTTGGVSMPDDLTVLGEHIYVSCMLDGGVVKLTLGGDVVHSVRLSEVRGITN